MERLTYRDANGEACYSDAGTEADRLHFIATIEDILGEGYDLAMLKYLMEAHKLIGENIFLPKDKVSGTVKEFCMDKEHVWFYVSGERGGFYLQAENEFEIKREEK